jgi:hypothetical protein
MKCLRYFILLALKQILLLWHSTAATKIFGIPGLNDRFEEFSECSLKFTNTLGDFRIWPPFTTPVEYYTSHSLAIRQKIGSRRPGWFALLTF